MANRSVGPTQADGLQTQDETMRTDAVPAGLPLSAATVHFLSLARSEVGIEELTEAFLVLVAPFGFRYVAVLDMGRAVTDPLLSIRFTTFRKEWVETLRRWRGTDCPVWNASLTGQGPFRWAAESERVGRGSDETLFFRSIGLVDGITIPVFSPQAKRSVVYLGAPSAIAMEDSDEAIVTLAAGILAARIFDQLGTIQPAGSLTLREREVLTWAALGKSARSTGLILDLSEKTVARHLLNIRDKLKVANTVQAVAVALRDGLISI